MKGTAASSGLVGVLSSGYSGLEVAGTLGALVGSLVALVALCLSFASNAAKRRKDATDDIEKRQEAIRLAELRGEERVWQIVETIYGPSATERFRRRHPDPHDPGAARPLPHPFPYNDPPEPV